MDGRELRRAFDHFNVKFFGGRFRGYRIRVVPRITKMGENGRFNRRTRTIELQVGLPDEEMIGTLLHEMAHSVSDAHSRRFAAEITRLRDSGAPLSPVDLRDLEETPHGSVQRLTRAEAENLASDAVIDDPRITLHQFAALVVQSIGYAPSVAALLRRYPWIKRVLAEARQSHRESEKRKQILLQERTASTRAQSQNQSEPSMP